MGYHTDFHGSFNLNKPLSNEHKAYLEAFAINRRMKRNAAVAENLPDPIRIAAGLPIGVDGAYFVNGKGYCGQDKDESVIESNYPPSGQPGLWCQWIPDAKGTCIVWDGGEKFYEYVDWIEYLIENFLKPWGYVLNGEVEWVGEDHGDRGMISIKNNLVKIKIAKIIYEEVG